MITLIMIVNCVLLLVVWELPWRLLHIRYVVVLVLMCQLCVSVYYVSVDYLSVDYVVDCVSYVLC